MLLFIIQKHLMSKKLLKKIGYYNLYEIKINNTLKYEIDNGKILYSKKYKKFIVNPYREIKSFDDINDAKKHIENKLKKVKKEKIKRTIKAKTLYLVLIRESKTNLLFIKVGITSKKFIINRFSKIYGYEGYLVESILRRIDTPYAEELEKKIKIKIKDKKVIKKYRPILESFSGYSECFDINYLNDIIEIFDSYVNNI